MRLAPPAWTLLVSSLLLYYPQGHAQEGNKSPGVQEKGESSGKTVDQKSKPVEIAETFEIAGGKVKAITASLPRGSKIDLEVKVLSGPPVDMHVMDETNYKLITRGDQKFHEQSELAHLGAVEYKRSGVLPSGTWFIVTHAPGHAGQLIESLVVDAGAMYLTGGLSLAKAALDIAKHKEGEPVSRVQIKLTIEEKPTPIVPAGAIPVDQAVVVEAHKESYFTLTIQPGAIPGRLIGTWASVGKSAGIKGAIDDTLVSFQIKGPDNTIVTPHMNHQFTGNFSVAVTGPGVYTFIFNNSGVIRSSARQVTLKGLYQPD